MNQELLQRRYDIMCSQYETLLKQYNHVLKLAKENADSHEFCLQELEAKVEELFTENEKLKERMLELNGEYLSLQVKYDKLRGKND